MRNAKKLSASKLISDPNENRKNEATEYEYLLKDTAQCGIDIQERPMVSSIKGLYGDGTIWINQSLQTTAEKACVLAEELGHYHTSSGDILDQQDTVNRKQELRARRWAYQRLIPLERLVDAYNARIKGRYELADFLGVTEPFLQSALDQYRDKYGLFTMIGDRYIIYFEPLRVAEVFALR
ncbi:ImmA/IrrE family metallo-endopeptidase [Paenibacillus sp. PR3]|uniref:ImmA/IrrE family metallo-endopeptidase n=1 Tax=Paenibacillus terricola TaxID=2763503 RepID=A0ABR8MSW1_9BACL|nr:ImmA/IrrE family metallo-endopeptidase [Paenibacillus terricola]MBD3917624.1 ImmA/IrrE family metallo-endopeptidase [Paenibacillus terricola]